MAIADVLLEIIQSSSSMNFKCSHREFAKSLRREYGISGDRDPVPPGWEA